MKRTATALALGVLIGMGIGPALAGAYSADPPQTARAPSRDRQNPEVTRQHPRASRHLASAEVNRFDVEPRDR